MTEFETKVTRLLDAHHIPYRLLPHNQPVYTVVEAAQQRGVVAEEMVKTILLRDKDQRYVMACVLGHTSLDPQAVRAALPGTWRRFSFATAEEIAAVTGFVQGAVAPVALPDTIPILFDEAITRCDKVTISSGDPMAGIGLLAQDLIRITNALVAPIARQSR